MRGHTDFATPEGRAEGEDTTLGSLGHADLVTLTWEGEFDWVTQTLPNSKVGITT